MHRFEPGQTVNTIEDAGANIHPDDLPVIAARFRAGVQDLTGLEYEYRVVCQTETNGGLPLLVRLFDLTWTGFSHSRCSASCRISPSANRPKPNASGCSLTSRRPAKRRRKPAG